MAGLGGRCDGSDKRGTRPELKGPRLPEETTVLFIVADVSLLREVQAGFPPTSMCRLSQWPSPKRPNSSRVTLVERRLRLCPGIRHHFDRKHSGVVQSRPHDYARSLVKADSEEIANTEAQY